MSIKITIEADEGSLRAALGNLISDLTGAIVTKPASAAPVAEDDRVVRSGAEARDAFVDFVSAWAVGLPTDPMGHWDAETAASPVDRVELIRKAGNSALNGAMLAFVQQCGGLTRAVDLVLPGDEDDRPGRSRDVAVNIAQVASILFPDLADLLEHRDPTLGEE